MEKLNGLRVCGQVHLDAVKALGMNEDVALGMLADWEAGKGQLPEELAKKFPQLAAVWHSEAVRALLADKVVLEALSDEQLITLPEVVE